MLTRLSLRGRGKSRREDGAAAIVAVFAALILFGFAALTVDLGNAMSRKGDTQVQADFAALAGGQLLPATKASNDPAVQAAAQYLLKNLPQDDRAHDPASWPPSVDDIATDLVDNDPSNGEVYLSDPYHLRVLSPQSNVGFGFSGVFSMFGGGGTADHVNVSSDATVMLGTPQGTHVWPMYVATPTGGNPGCDYGVQTLTDPPGGHVVLPAVPTLFADGDTNENSLTGISVYDAGVAVGGLDQYSTGGTITLHGDFKNAARVGFFRSDSPTTAPVEVANSSTDWVAPAGATPYSANNGQITVKVPASVTASDILWYVRVYRGGTTNKWSARAEAQPLSVGDAPFECLGGAQSGNFGTLKLPRTDSSSLWIPLNIAKGVQAPITLSPFPSPAPWECSTDPRAVISTAASRKPGTNCVDTDTGLTSQTATDGFITGVGSVKGLLNQYATSEDPDGSGGCAPDGTTSPLTILGRDLNNDVLTCFLTDTTTALGTVARSSYAGGPKFSPDIYNSPRFGWVPVFSQETQQGGSNKYSITGFRPVFLTDQPMTATKADNAVNSSTQNGLGMNGNRLETIKVVFINPNALPDGTADTPIGPYLGPDLPKVVRLVD